MPDREYYQHRRYSLGPYLQKRLTIRAALPDVASHLEIAVLGSELNITGDHLEDVIFLEREVVSLSSGHEGMIS